MNIRQYEPRDQEDVWKLHNVALDDAGAHAGNGSWDDDLHDIDTVYAMDRGAFPVGVLNDQIVAMGALKKMIDSTAEIKRMRVDPKLQGRGLGKKMLLALENQATKYGYSTIKLDTTSIQSKAQQLYEHSGYRRVGIKEFQGFEVICYKKKGF